MAASAIGIIYASGSKMIRRVVVPDTDEQLLKAGWIGEGESMLIAPQFAKGDPAPVAYVIDQMTKATGVVPPDPACAVVANGIVERMIAADPAIDSLPGKMLVAAYSKEIGPGCTYDPIGKLFTKPAMTIPAGLDRNGQPMLQRDVPAAVIAMPVDVAIGAVAIGDVQP